MLVRFAVENVLSFGEQKEFTMLPNTRLKTLKHHKYNVCNLELLKMTAIYGGNAVGKSNMIKALSLMQDYITDEISITLIRKNQFKFRSNIDEKQFFAIEFIQDEVPFYYAIEIDKNSLSSEKLYISGLGRTEDQMLYERQTDSEKRTTITFNSGLEKKEKIQVLKQVLIEDFIEPDKPIFSFLSKRDNKDLKDIKNAYKWFERTLQIIEPDSIPISLVDRIEKEENFKNYVEDMMCAFDIGITSITFDKKEIRDFFGKEDDDEVANIINKIENSTEKKVGLRSLDGDTLIIFKEGDSYFVKQLKLEHTGKDGIQSRFELNEESDGTRRLLDFIPAFRNLVVKNRVYIVDEIERSIHPLLIKELIKKFSNDFKTKGQLIFTTHESNLLDQDLFRQDEIWFAEKDKNGSTDLYSLVAFSEHKTIDIRKGYLNGRYGAIPFLGNLQDLNWHKYDVE